MQQAVPCSQKGQEANYNIASNNPPINDIPSNNPPSEHAFDCPATVVGPEVVSNWVPPVNIAGERNCYNLTREDIKAGLKKVEEWMPEELSVFAANEELLIDLAFRNVIPSEDTPLPDGVPRVSSLAQPRGDVTAQLDPCVGALVGVGVDVIGLVFEILGFNYANNGNVTILLADKLILGSGAFATNFRKIIKTLDNLPTLIEVAGGAVELLYGLWDESIVIQAVRYYFAHLNWWRRTVNIIRWVATVLSWLISFPLVAVQILQVFSVAVSIADLVESFKGVAEEC